MNTQTNRLQPIDACRGIAAMLVVLFHYTTHYSERYGQAYEPAVTLPWGYLGVNFFFIVSGFVIFMTLDKTRRGMDFVVSRFSRLYPAYWLAVALTSLFVLLYGLPEGVTDPFDILANFTMLQGLWGVPYVDGVYWTLTLELLFYGWMYLLYETRQLHRIQTVVGLWVGFAVGARLLEMRFGYFPWKITVYCLLQYIHLFAAGILFFLIYKKRATAATYGLLCLCLVHQFLLGPRVLDNLLVALFFGIFWLLATDRLRWLSGRFLSFLGLISYTLYLLHQNIGYVLLDLFRRAEVSPNLAVPATLVIAILLATLVTTFVEQPAMKAIRNYYRAQLENKTAATRHAAPARSEDDLTPP